MRLFLSALIATTLAGCVPPAIENSRSTGFDAYLAGDRNGYTPITTSKQVVHEPNRLFGEPTPADASNPTEFRRASESAFGIGSQMRGENMYVGDQSMRIRLVKSRGLTFAVIEQPGYDWWGKSSGRELIPQLETATRQHTGCTPTGKYAMKQFTTSARTKYALHVYC